MKLKQELLLRAICAYSDKKVARFRYKNLDWFGREYTITRNLQNMTDYLEKVNSNGAYSEYKIKKYLECPKFILNTNFEIGYKLLLLGLYKYRQELPDEITKTILIKYTGQSSATVSKYYTNTLKEDMLNNSAPIKIDILEDTHLQQIDNNYYYVNSANCSCKICKENNPDNFYYWNKSICKKCITQIRKDRDNSDMAYKLWKNSRKSYHTRNSVVEHTISKEDIQEILDKQEYKCYYTRVPLKIGDKYTNPTLDRIDSTKGYIPGNIVICTEFVNCMKNDATLSQFKDIITKLYNNINNF